MCVIILQWPGYESVDFSVPIDVRGITVCQLAGKVASSYQDFFKVDLDLYYCISVLLIVVYLFC